MNESHQQLVLYILRHGETRLNHRLVGTTDPELSERGWQQLWRAVDGLDIHRIITSPLQRCKAFATQLAAQKAVDCQVNHSLSEIDFGDWDGRSWDEIPVEASEGYFQDPWSHTPPNGEALIDFDKRIRLAMEKLLSKPTAERWLLIVHGGVIKSIIAWAMGLTGIQHHCYNRVEIAHASVSQLTINWHQQQRFVTINSINQTR